MPLHGERQGQRRLRRWTSGRWAGGCACCADGTALEDRPRLVARHRIGMTCQQSLLGDWPQQGRLERGQPERGLDQRQARQDAKGRRLGRPEPRCGLLRLEVPLLDVRFRRGESRRQMNRQGGARERSNRQESGETCREAATQLPRAMPSPADKHLIVSCATNGPDGHGPPGTMIVLMEDCQVAGRQQANRTRRRRGSRGGRRRLLPPFLPRPFLQVRPPPKEACGRSAFRSFLGLLLPRRRLPGMLRRYSAASSQVYFVISKSRGSDYASCVGLDRAGGDAVATVAACLDASSWSC